MNWDRQMVGEVSPSQLMYAYGIGSIIDLPSLSTLVMGLDDWNLSSCREISEPRLLTAVQQRLGNQVASLVSPPMPDSGTMVPAGPFEPEAIGVPVAAFPRWQVCPFCHLLAPLSSGLFELKTAPHRPDRARYVHVNCRRQGEKLATIPARFMVACEKGHLDDFPWKRFVHRSDTSCRSRLYIREYGMTGQAADVVVGCELCNATRRMSAAFEKEERDFLDGCTGRHPQLREREPDCTGEPQPILLGASNSWFPILLSVVSIPSGIGILDALLDQYWASLEKVQSAREISLLRSVGVLRDLAGYSDDDIWEATKRRTEAAGEEDDTTVQNLRIPEWNTFSRADQTRNGRDFSIREATSPEEFKGVLRRVLLVERLREVGAFLGFTRVESPGDFAAVEELPPDRIAPIARHGPYFVPGSEVRGEGIFLQFKWDAIKEWLQGSKAVRERALAFNQGHYQFRKARRYREPGADFPGLEYVLIHSFSHALIRQLALECGYPTTSIAERIYSGEGEAGEQMAGILLYTSAPDSEGTLGGLVRLGEPDELGRHIAEALDTARICSSDPLCAEHSPSDPESHTIHGAACHACLFLPETSCERGNRYLDRAVLVDTLADSRAEFFS